MNRIEHHQADGPSITIGQGGEHHLYSDAECITVFVNQPVDATPIVLYHFIETMREVDYKILSNADVKIVHVYNKTAQSMKSDFKTTIHVGTDAQCVLYDLNLLKRDWRTLITVVLNGENARYTYYMATLSVNQCNKYYSLKTVHKALRTYSNIVTYSICKNKSCQTVDCQTEICQGMHRSEAHQELRLMVFDKFAKAFSNPTLIIDDNDIIASHANAVGMLDPDQMFYLQTRGLNVREAKLLICLSYFKTVLDFFQDENWKNTIIDEIMIQMDI